MQVCVSETWLLADVGWMLSADLLTVCQHLHTKINWRNWLNSVVT
jgi:hypothetical protein